LRIRNADSRASPRRGEADLQRRASDRFGFDVEALYLARKHGFRIDELPVTVR
jgi:hypothetical protein